ncbi:MAG: cold-shock protein [Myxococcaceae bacterium]|nr:MAG: cold-shock protein [Myxococcaceae bacterium]
MADGTVQWFNEVKSLGAILPDDKTEIVIVECPEGATPLVEGQKVSFDLKIVEETYGRMAVNVKPKK